MNDPGHIGMQAAITFACARARKLKPGRLAGADQDVPTTVGRSRGVVDKVPIDPLHRISRFDRYLGGREREVSDFDLHGLARGPGASAHDLQHEKHRCSPHESSHRDHPRPLRRRVQYRARPGKGGGYEFE